METITISKRKPTGAWFKTYFSILLIALIFGFSSCQDESSNQLTEDYLKGLELGTPSGTSQSAPVVYFEKRRFTRTTDAPFEEIVRLENPNFEHFSGDFVLKVQNGSDKQTRVSSAEIIVDGETIVSQADFSKNVSIITKRLQGLTPESVLEAKLSSTPGSFLEIWIEGTLKPNHVLVTSEGGEFVFLDGILTLLIPEGAVDGAIILSVSDFSNLLSDNERSNFFKVIELLPHNFKFNTPILGYLRLPEFNDEDNPIMIYRDDTKRYGIEIPSRFDQNSQILSFNLEHFSYYYIGFTRRHKLQKDTDYSFSLTSFSWVLDDYSVIKQLKYPSGQVLMFANENVDRAFKHWQTFSCEFNTTFNNSPNITTQADITVGFMSQAEANKFGLYFIRWLPDILDANAIVLYTYDQFSNVIQRHIILNSDETWVSNYLNYSREGVYGPLLESVITHEIGHLFGLDDEYRKFLDCKNNLSVMGSYYANRFPISPFDYDIENLRKKYNISTFSYGSVAGIKPLSTNMSVGGTGRVFEVPLEFQVFDVNGNGVKNATVIFECISGDLQILSDEVALSDSDGNVSIDRWKVDEVGTYSINASVWSDPKYLTSESCPGTKSIIKIATIDLVVSEDGLDEDYQNDFSGDLSDWTPIDGSWQIQNGRLIANYGIGCGSIWCPQADLILKDQFQPSGDWELSVDFTYAPDNSYNYGASGAAVIIWESPSKKIRIGIGNGGTVPWGTNPETIMPVSFCAWDGTWDNSRWNYINYTWSPREWHTMTIDKTGNVYTVYVDNDYLWRYTDNYMNGTGKIGLQTYGPKIYDNFIIRTKN